MISLAVINTLSNQKQAGGGKVDLTHTSGLQYIVSKVNAGTESRNHGGTLFPGSCVGPSLARFLIQTWPTRPGNGAPHSNIN